MKTIISLFLFALMTLQIPAEDRAGVTAAEARKIIADGYRNWGRARVALDREVFEKMLAPDFAIQQPGRKLARQEFIDGISVGRPNEKLTRYDITVLTVQSTADAWVAIAQEKVEIEAPGKNRGYSLKIMRAGWKQIDNRWMITSMEFIGHENWTGGAKPPFLDWGSTPVAAIPYRAQQTEFPRLTGPSLGQKPPGMTPEVFAPGVVSREGIQMKLTMTADGAEILYTERYPATNAASFIIRRRAGDSWGEPLVLPYSREYMDIEPSLSPDGKKILFVSNRPASGQGEPGKLPDIWMAEKTGEQWGSPVRLGPPVWTDDAADIEAHPAFLPDGGIYFMRQNGKSRRLVRAALRGDGFDALVPLPLKEDLLAGQFSGPCFSPDGRTLLMHSRQEGGFGSWDLYVTFEDGSGGWSELKNLGPAVNTDKPESSPTFSPDGRFLFFTRETDIYWVSTQVIEELRPKKSAESLGPAHGLPHEQSRR